MKRDIVCRCVDGWMGIVLLQVLTTTDSLLAGHINNLYNTCYWNLIHAGHTPESAEQRLRVSSFEEV